MLQLLFFSHSFLISFPNFPHISSHIFSILSIIPTDGGGGFLAHGILKKEIKRRIHKECPIRYPEKRERSENDKKRNAKENAGVRKRIKNIRAIIKELLLMLWIS